MYVSGKFHEETHVPRLVDVNSSTERICQDKGELRDFGLSDVRRYCDGYNKYDWHSGLEQNNVTKVI